MSELLPWLTKRLAGKINTKLSHYQIFVVQPELTERFEAWAREIGAEVIASTWTERCEEIMAQMPHLCGNEMAYKLRHSSFEECEPGYIVPVIHWQIEYYDIRPQTWRDRAPMV